MLDFFRDSLREESSGGGSQWAPGRESGLPRPHDSVQLEEGGGLFGNRFGADGIPLCRPATFRTSGASAIPTPAPPSFKLRVLAPPRMLPSTWERRLFSSTGPRPSDRAPRSGYASMREFYWTVMVLTDIFGVLGNLGESHPTPRKWWSRPCQVRTRFFLESMYLY